jgi:hypothetical protein
LSILTRGLQKLRIRFEKDILAELDERAWIEEVYGSCITLHATGGIPLCIDNINSLNLRILDIYHTSKKLIGQVQQLDEEEAGQLEEFVQRVGKTSDRLGSLHFYVREGLDSLKAAHQKRILLHQDWICKS